MKNGLVAINMRFNDRDVDNVNYSCWNADIIRVAVFNQTPYTSQTVIWGATRHPVQRIT